MVTPAEMLRRRPAHTPPRSAQSPWAHKFHPSAGHLTGVPLQALWLSNGDRHLVLLKVDLIGSFDGLVGRLERGLSQSTGIDMTGSVVMACSHSHSAPAALFPEFTILLLVSIAMTPGFWIGIAEQARPRCLVGFPAIAASKIGFWYRSRFRPRR